MRRRALLSSTAALAAGTAGCLNRTGTDGETQSGTDDPTRTTTDTTSDGANATTTSTTDAVQTVTDGDTVTLDDRTLTLDGITIQSSFVEQRWPMWDAHASPTGLFAVLALRGGDVQANDLRNPPVHARADGDPLNAPGGVYVNVRDQRATLVAVPIPRNRALDTATIALDTQDGTRHYPLDDSHLRTIQNPPELTATANIPDEIPADESLTYSLTVQNDGDTPGTIAATSTHDAIHDAWWTRRRTIAPDETETIHYEPYHTTGDLEITIDWGLAETVEPVTVHDTTTTE